MLNQLCDCKYNNWQFAGGLAQVVCVLFSSYGFY